MMGTSPATTTLNIATTARPVTTGSLLRRHLFYATWLPVGGLSLLGLSVGAGYKRRRWLAGALLGLMAGIILLQGACGKTSSTTTTGGTPAGTYTITITGASGSVSHNTTVQLTVN
jgi:trimeric autotransporter adhesin